MHFFIKVFSLETSFVDDLGWVDGGLGMFLNKWIEEVDGVKFFDKYLGSKVYSLRHILNKSLGVLKLLIYGEFFKILMFIGSSLHRLKLLDFMIELLILVFQWLGFGLIGVDNSLWLSFELVDLWVGLVELLFKSVKFFSCDFKLLLVVFQLFVFGNEWLLELQ